MRDAFKLAADKINAKGGVMGRKIEFVTRDSKFKVDLGLAAAKELILRENVDILMGTINSALALADFGFVQKEKMPFFATFAKSDKITGANGHRYVFSITENTAIAGKAAAQGLAKMPYTNYWIAGDDYEYGHALADGRVEQSHPAADRASNSWASPGGRWASRISRPTSPPFWRPSPTPSSLPPAAATACRF